MIPVRNIYYMLAYAFRCMGASAWNRAEHERFDNALDFCAELLAISVLPLVKRGLTEDYVQVEEIGSLPKGKILFGETLREQASATGRVAYSADMLSSSTYLNRIIKTIILALLHSPIDRARCDKLAALLPEFGSVDTLELRSVRWRIRLGRDTALYRTPLELCEMVAKGMIWTEGDGSVKVREFIDEQQMCRLYERFIFEYYRREHPDLSVSAPHISWFVDDGFDDYLPAMRTDALLRKDGKVLIVDAKYYSRSMQVFLGSISHRSGNIYQLFSYVKNYQASHGDAASVSGMLLYARTDETITPDQTYTMGGNRIAVKSLDLNCDFSQVRAQLDALVDGFF